MIKPQVVNKLKSITELQVLLHISGLSEWSNNKVTRTILTDKLDIADITIKCVLRSLLQKTLIEKISKGVYRINKDILL